ncbi:hypothetical protein ACLB2K_019631 [Fragaria x ananassa]
MTIRSQSKEEEGQQLVPRQLFHPWMARSRDSIYLVRLIPGFPSLQSSSQPPRKLEKLISFIQKYKETGFNDALIIAKEIASEMKVEPVFYEKRTIRKIKHFDDSDNEEELAQSALESFKISYFLYIIDQTLSSLQSRCRREEEEEVSRAEKRRRRRSCRREEEEKEAALLGGGGGAAAKEEEEAPRRGGVGVAAEKRRSGSCRQEEEEEEAALLGGGGGAAAKEEEEAPLWWGSNQTRERESSRRAREREMKRMRERELKVIEWNRKKFQNFWRDHCRLKF